MNGETLGPPYESLWDSARKLGKIGWYTISGWARPCPECGCYRGGTPGHYWHLIRENTDDEERIREVHGEGEY